MEKKETKLWIPFYVDKWLFGSTRIELTPEERGVWIDLLAIAAKDNGHIRANEGVPYPLDQLAGLLRVPEPLLKRTITKCLRRKKLARMKDRTLYICNWDKYQFTDRHKRRIDSDIKEQYRIRKERIGKDRPSEKRPRSPKKRTLQITFNFQQRKWEGITIEDKAGWLDAYPSCDIEHELRGMREWLLSNPEKKKTRYRRFITNWLSRTQDKGGSEKYKRHPGGRPMTRKEERDAGIKDWIDKSKEDKK